MLSFYSWARFIIVNKSTWCTFFLITRRVALFCFHGRPSLRAPTRLPESRAVLWERKHHPNPLGNICAPQQRADRRARVAACKLVYMAALRFVFQPPLIAICEIQSLATHRSNFISYHCVALVCHITFHPPIRENLFGPTSN